MDNENLEFKPSDVGRRVRAIWDESFFGTILRVSTFVMAEVRWDDRTTTYEWRSAVEFVGETPSSIYTGGVDNEEFRFKPSDIGRRVKSTCDDHAGQIDQILDGECAIVLWDDGLRSIEDSEDITFIDETPKPSTIDTIVALNGDDRPAPNGDEFETKMLRLLTRTS